MTMNVPTIDQYVTNRGKLMCERGGWSLSEAPAMDRPGVVSVITVTLNSAATLAKTMESVFAQTHPEIEYLIIDGGSTDRTLDIVREREDRVDLWITEPDQGISDAFNKGIALSSGEFIALVNSDDWLDPEHMSRSIECLRRTGAGFSFGNLMLHNPDGSPMCLVRGDADYIRNVHHAMPAANHPSVVSRRAIYEQHGLFDREYRIAMDYEWLIRAHTAGVRGVYVAEVTSHMGSTGVSQRRIRDSLREVRRASIQYGYPRPLAHVRYGVRLMKLGTRQFIERWMSRALAGRLRGLTNRGYRRIESTSNRSE